MSKAAIQRAINKMDKGLGLYSQGLNDLDEVVNRLGGNSVVDIVREDDDRSDAILAISEGISADADDILSWIDEYKKEHEEKQT